MDEKPDPEIASENAEKSKRLKVWKDRISRAKKLREDFEYNSLDNKQYLSTKEMQKLLEELNLA